MEHPFLPETSNGGQGAPRSPTIAVLLSAAKVSKASFFFFNIHGRNEKVE